MLLSGLFFKLSLENFLSQQRETQTHSASEQQVFPRWQDLICEWPSVQARGTMWLIVENLHCLHSRSQRSCCTKRFFCHGAQPPVFVESTLQTSQLYCLKVMHLGGLIRGMIQRRAISLF